MQAEASSSENITKSVDIVLAAAKVEPTPDLKRVTPDSTFQTRATEPSVDCAAEPVCIPASLESPEYVDSVDKNGNKVYRSSTDVVTPNSADSANDVVSTPVKSSALTPEKSRGIVLTPLKEFHSSNASSPSTASNRRCTRNSTPPRSHGTASETPWLRVTKSRTPTPKKPSTPSKSKSPLSSPRQRSLVEMFSRSDAAATSKIAAKSQSVLSETLSDQEQLEKSAETSPCDVQSRVNVEVLVEDSQIGPSSPVRVVDTQESMFVDETPPKADDGQGVQPTEACDADTSAVDTSGADTVDTSAADSFLSNEAAERTVVMVDVTNEFTDRSHIATVSDASKVSAHGVDGVTRDSQTLIVSAYCLRDVPSRSFSSAAGNVKSHDADTCSQQVLFNTEHIEVHGSGQLQPTADGFQHSSNDHTHESSIPSTKGLLDHNQEKDDVAMATDTEDDIPPVPVTGSQSDAGKSFGAADDVSLSPHTRLRMMGRAVKCDHHCRAATKPSHKDSVHSTLRGRVTRHVTDTRPTRLNLRTRSVRRLSNKLVSVGPKKVDASPSDVHQPRGRPRKYMPDDRGHRESAKKGVKPFTRSAVKPATRILPPRRIVSLKSRRSVLTKAVAAELGIAEPEIDETSPDKMSAAHATAKKPGDTCRVTSRRSVDEVSANLLLEASDDKKTVQESTTETIDTEFVATEKLLVDNEVEEERRLTNADVEPDRMPERSVCGEARSDVVVEPSADVKVLSTESSHEPESDMDIALASDTGRLEATSCGEPLSGVEASQTVSSDSLESAVTSSAKELTVFEDSEFQPTPQILTGQSQQSQNSTSTEDILTRLTSIANATAAISGNIPSALANHGDVDEPVKLIKSCKPESVSPPSGEIARDTPLSDADNSEATTARTLESAALCSVREMSIIENSGERSETPSSLGLESGNNEPSNIVSSAAVTADDEVPRTCDEVEKSTPPPASSDAVGSDGQWKVPTSTASRGPPGDAPPETPTSVPRRRFTTRGSLMLERAKQIRQMAAAASPPLLPKSSEPLGSEEEATDQSPVSSRPGCNGLSKLRVFSPAASPSAGILRKRQLSADAAASVGYSPASPSSKVSYQFICYYLFGVLSITIIINITWRNNRWTLFKLLTQIMGIKVVAGSVYIAAIMSCVS